MLYNRYDRLYRFFEALILLRDATKHILWFIIFLHNFSLCFIMCNRLSNIKIRKTTIYFFFCYLYLLSVISPLTLFLTLLFLSQQHLPIILGYISEYTQTLPILITFTASSIARTPNIIQIHYFVSLLPWSSSFYPSVYSQFSTKRIG